MAGDALSTHFSVDGVQSGSVSSSSFVSTSKHSSCSDEKY